MTVSHVADDFDCFCRRKKDFYTPQIPRKCNEYINFNIQFEKKSSFKKNSLKDCFL